MIRHVIRALGPRPDPPTPTRTETPAPAHRAPFARPRPLPALDRCVDRLIAGIRCLEDAATIAGRADMRDLATDLQDRAYALHDQYAALQRVIARRVAEQHEEARADLKGDINAL